MASTPACSLVFLTAGKFFPVRNPHGFHPLVIGCLHCPSHVVVFASETYADHEHDVQSGKILMLDDKENEREGGGEGSGRARKRGGEEEGRCDRERESPGGGGGVKRKGDTMWGGEREGKGCEVKGGTMGEGVKRKGDVMGRRRGRGEKGEGKGQRRGCGEKEGRRDGGEEGGREGP